MISSAYSNSNNRIKDAEDLDRLAGVLRKHGGWVWNSVFIMFFEVRTRHGWAKLLHLVRNGFIAIPKVGNINLVIKVKGCLNQGKWRPIESESDLEREIRLAEYWHSLTGVLPLSCSLLSSPFVKSLSSIIKNVLFCMSLPILPFIISVVLFQVIVKKPEGLYCHIRAEAKNSPSWWQSRSKWVTRSLKWPKTHLWLEHCRQGELWGTTTWSRSCPLTAQGATTCAAGFENVWISKIFFRATWTGNLTWVYHRVGNDVTLS